MMSQKLAVKGESVSSRRMVTCGHLNSGFYLKNNMTTK